MVMSNIKIIRGLWGNLDLYKHEIPLKPLHNEMVYVWGVDNLIKLTEMGYEVTLMGEDITNPSESFNLKLDCLIKGQEDFGEIIFIDWDVKQIKDIDVTFYKELRENKFSMPTYSYPIEYLELTEGKWVESIISEFKKYGWRLNQSIIIPNAGFIYSNNSDIPLELKKITNNHNIKTLIEEFSMWVYSNCNLEDYIKMYEPKCIYGRPDRIFKLNHIETNSEKDLHSLIDGLMNKNIYFIHE